MPNLMYIIKCKIVVFPCMLFNIFGDFAIILNYENADNKE